ncbi:MAG: SCO family protein [Hyphomicrobiaceae bacterium]
MRLKLLAIILAAFVAGGGLALALRSSDMTTQTGSAAIGGAFSLIDQDGRRVSDKTYAGRYLLVFFGFTHCPDICPAGLQVMGAALDQLGAKADGLVPLFVTVDPARDTPEVMKAYVSAFHPRLVGLTGSQAEVDAMVRAYRVYAKRVDDLGSADGYTMDHSGFIYLMDTAGHYVTHFRHSASPEEIASRIAPML